METPAAPPPPAPPPRRKRWKKVLLIVGSVLAGLVLLVLLLGPTIISSVARSKIPAIVSDMLEADATVGDVSFSWSGRIGIRDLRIVPRGFSAPLLELPQVDVSVSLLSAAGGSYIADVEVVGPKVVVEKRADGRFSYQVTKPPAAPVAAPATPSAPSAPPYVVAKVRVRDGEVALRAHGQETIYRNVTLEAAVDTLAKPIVYALSLAGPAQDRIAVKGEYAISSGSGPVAVELERLSLKNLAAAARAFGPVEGLDGSVTGRLDYELKGAPAASGKARLAVSDLFLRAGGRDLRLAAAELAHEGGIDAKGSGHQVISLSAGRAVGAKLEVDLADLFGTMSAKVGFKPFESDLGALRELLAGFLPADLSFRGTASIWGRAGSKGRTGWADLRLETKGLSITQGKQTYALGTLGASLAARLDEQGDGEITLTPTLDGVVTGTVNVAATDVFGARKAKTEIALVTELKGAADLLRSWGFVPADLVLEGKAALKGTVESEGPRDEDLAKGFLKVPATWTFESLGRGIRGSAGGRAFEVGDVTHTNRGAVDANGNGRSTAVLDSGAAMHAEIVTDLTGVFGEPGVVATLKAESDLAEVGRRLQGFLKADTDLAGKASVSGRAELRGAAGARADLSATVTGLAAVDRKTKKAQVLDPEVRLKLAAGWDAARRRATLETLSMNSSFATADGKGSVTLGEKPGTFEIGESSLTLNADLKKLADQLASFLEKPLALGGTASIKARAAGEKVGVDGTLAGLRYEKYGPFDATLTHTGTVNAEGNGRHALKLDAGRMLSAGAEAEVKGTAVTIGSFKAESDLGALARALPGLLETKPGTTLAGKASVSGRAAVRGAEAASFEVKGTLENLEAVDAKGARQPVEASATLESAGAWDGAAKRFDLASFVLKSSFATADSRGGFLLGGEAPSVKDSTLRIDLDLGALGAKLKAFLEDPPAMAGRVGVTGTYAGDRFDLTAKAEGVKAETKTTSVGPVDATLVQKGEFSLKPGGSLKIEACRLDSSAVTVEVKGEVRKVMDKAREGSLTLTAGADPVELSKWVKDLGLGGPKIALETTLTLGGEALKVAGRTKLDGLTMKAKDAAGKEFVRTAKSGPVEFTVEQGKDLAAAFRTASFEWTEPAYAAKCSLDARVTMSGKVISGTTKVGNLEVVDDQKNVVKDPGLTLRHEVEVDAGTIDLRKVVVESGFVKGEVKGRIEEKDGVRSFKDLRLNLEYLPDRMAALLKPWLPGKLEGAEWKSLQATLDGRAASGDLLAIFRGVTSETTLDLAKFTKDGMAVSGRSAWKLQDGVLSSGTPLDVNGGKSSLHLSVDFREEKRRPRSSLVLGCREVGANAEMKVLEKINPIFSTVNGTVDGRITSDFNLVWDGPVDPAEKDWTAAAAKRLSGSGVFGMKDLSITGSETVGKIMAVMGEPNALKGELVATNITLGQGKCSYTNMTLRLARYELRFSGQVTFDGKLQLQVDLPFTEHMIRKNPGLAKYTGQRFSVNLTGTVAKPDLDFEATIAAYLKRALEGVIQDKAKDLLDNLLKDKKKKP